MRRSAGLAVVVVAGALGAPPAVAAADRAPAADTPTARASAAAPVRVGSRAARVRGRHGYARAFRTPRRIPAAVWNRLQRGFKNVNPATDLRPGLVPAAPRTLQSLTPLRDALLDRFRRSDPPNPPAPLRAGSGASAAADPAARAAASTDLEIYRSTPVARGTNITMSTGEPSVANDRDAILFTGNRHAAISGDHGLSWSYLDPGSRAYPQYDAGFCCDQVAYTVDREDGPPLILWLRQMANDGDTTPSDGANGRISLIVFQGRKELLSQSDWCEFSFKPSDFGFPDNSWFDFPQISHTRSFLYVSSKAMLNNGDTNGDGIFDSTFADGVVFRLSLNQLASDGCSVTPRAWSGIAADANPALVQVQGGFDRIHWASHGATTDEIKITRVTDAEITADVFTRPISPYTATPRGTANCAVPDGSDPCDRINDFINTGYYNGFEMGWFWNVKEGAGFPFPYIRGVRFNTSLQRIGEPEIWNRDFAWIYPAVGVGNATNVGVIATKLGGGSFPRPAVALVDDVTPGWDSLRFAGVITSTHGTSTNTWGDYMQTRQYVGCENSFAGSVMSQQGGDRDWHSEHRFVWFGRQRDRCADLAVVSLAAYRSNLADGGGPSVTIAHTTRNIGSATVPDSRTRFYLSRDADKDASDIRLGEHTAVPAMQPGVSTGDLLFPPAPPGATGTYYVLACADDGNLTREVTNANNCMAAPETVTFDFPGYRGLTPTRLTYEAASLAATAGAPAQVGVTLNVPSGAPSAATLSLRVGTVADAGSSREIGRSTVRLAGAARASARRVTVRRTVRIPRGLARRRQFLIVCVGAGRPAAGRCLPAREPIFVRGVRRL